MSKYNTYDDPPPAYSVYYDRSRVPFNSRGNNRRITHSVHFTNEYEPLININKEPNSSTLAICGLLVFMITFSIIGFSIANIEIPPKIPDDVTKVPRTFQLRWRSRFGDDYTMVIESYDTDYKGLSGFSEHNYTNETNEEPVTANRIQYPIRALILDRNYNKGEYSVEEYFYKPNHEDYYKRIITANAEFKGNWPAEFLITFTSKGSDRDPDSVEVCDYKLSYSKDLTGHVSRKCTKASETRFLKQAYVYGSVEHGLYFTESEESDTWYAFTTKPSWLISYSRRDVFVHDYAPFPPLIPALYSVYYDFLSQKLEE